MRYRLEERAFSGFKLTNTRYPSGGYKDPKVISWKAEEIDSLAEMLGLTQLEETTYGHGRFELDGTKVDVNADRSKPAIIVQVGNMYDKRVRINKDLSDKQVKNLKNKIAKQVESVKDSQNVGELRDKVRKELYAKGIQVSGGSDFQVNGKDIKLDGDSVRFVGQIGGRTTYFNFKDGEKGVQRILDEVKKRAMDEINSAQEAVDIAEENIELMKKYISLTSDYRK